MKKLLAIVLSVMMVVSIGFGTVATAYAATTIASQETTKKRVKPTATVNGNKTGDVEIEYDDDDPNTITVTYTGEGEFSHWNYYDGDGNLLVEGVDYIVVVDGNPGTIKIISDIDKVVFDAVVKGVKEEDTTKPNNKPTSPETGAMGFAGLAVAGAGVAVLSALKRKSDAE